MYQVMMIEIGDVKKRRGQKEWRQDLYNTNFNEQCWKTQLIKELQHSIPSIWPGTSTTRKGFVCNTFTISALL